MPLEDAPQAPPSLVQAITRPLHDFKSSGGGEHSPEQCAAMLDVLDPKDFSKNDEWFPIMCAVHHASGGDAREEFISWCISDPAFANQADEIGVRWDSLHREKPGAITVQTLYKALRDAGRADMISQPTAKDDFADAPEILPTPEEKKADDRRKERFKAQSLSELLAIPDPKWLVEDVLTENALFEIFGSFKAGKTFYGMEMGLRYRDRTRLLRFEDHARPGPLHNRRRQPQAFWLSRQRMGQRPREGQGQARTIARDG